MEPMTDSKNLMECVYYWEKNTPDRMYLTQPMGGGDANIRTWSWKEAIDEARRMVEEFIAGESKPSEPPATVDESPSVAEPVLQGDDGQS